MRPHEAAAASSGIARMPVAGRWPRTVGSSKRKYETPAAASAGVKFVQTGA